MLSQYQTAILEEMGIVAYSEQQKQVPSKRTSQPIIENKIQALRESLGASSSPVVSQLINDPKSHIVKDIQLVFENTDIDLPIATKWQVNTEQSTIFTAGSVTLPNQPNQLSSRQKKALWAHIVPMLIADD